MRVGVAWLLRAVAQVLARSWRFEVIGAEHLAAARRDGRGFVFALWHRSLLPLLWRHRRQGVTLVVSQHADGELVAVAAARWGYRILRGSTTRGGGPVARGLLRALRAGREVALTPDGPRGPAGIPKPGALAVARRTQTAILPVAADAARRWQLGSWDRMVIPYPFARVRIVYAAPFTVSDETVGGDASSLAARLDSAARRARCPW